MNNFFDYKQNTYQAPQQASYLVPFDICYLTQRVEALAFEHGKTQATLEFRGNQLAAAAGLIKQYGASYIFSSRGIPIQVFADQLSRAEYFCYDELFEREKMLHLTFRSGRTLDINESTFASDKKLSQAFAVSGLPITAGHGNFRIIMDHIRAEIRNLSCQRRVRFYLGWICDREWENRTNIPNVPFITFNKKTCNLQGYPEFESTPPQSATTSTKNFYSIISTIQSLPMRVFLTLWAHICVLKSLTEMFGYHPRLALLLVVRNAAARSFITRFFQIFSSEEISTALPPKNFSKQLLFSKDTLLLIMPSQCDSNPINLATALNAIDAGVIWNGSSRPLQSLATIISDTLPAAAISEKSIVLDVAPNDMGAVDMALLLHMSSVLPDYFISFCSYVSTHIDVFQECMRCGQNIALQEDFVQESCATMFGMLTGTYDLISEYLKSLNLQQILPPLTPEGISFMKDALDTSDRAGINNIGETFLYFARELLGNGEIQLCPYASIYSKHSQTASNPIAYINDTTVSLNQAAFKLITDRLPQSSPLILKALCEIGALAGARTNSSTFRTKIRVIDSSGCRQCISVVRLNRELLEEPGVPLSF